MVCDHYTSDTVFINAGHHFNLAMHIDTDEANAANIKPGAVGHIDSIQGRT